MNIAVFQHKIQSKTNVIIFIKLYNIIYVIRAIWSSSGITLLGGFKFVSHQSFEHAIQPYLKKRFILLNNFKGIPIAKRVINDMIDYNHENTNQAFYKENNQLTLRDYHILKNVLAQH